MRLYLLSFFTFLLCSPITLAQGLPENQRISKGEDHEITIHEDLHEIPNLPEGPFVRLGEEQILSAASSAGTDILISVDNGKNWKAYPVFENPEKFKLGSTAVQRTDEGTVILAFINLAELHSTRNKEGKFIMPGARAPTYVVRSLDNGRTWEDPEMLHEEWTGMNTDMIITSDGNIVFTSMNMLFDPVRHGVLTYMSEDQGETWQRSNIIDLGGEGHHDGVSETTIEELNDGRLLGLMRTPWMELWRIESKDGGRTWHPFGPSGIPSASTHARLTRLQSGRLLLVWNRPYPEGEDSSPVMKGGDRIWSAVPASNYRSELSIAFSEDDGATWSDSVVIARAKEEGRRVSYPFAFEFAPGEIWVTTGQGPLRAKFYEEDFVIPK